MSRLRTTVKATATMHRSWGRAVAGAVLHRLTHMWRLDLGRTRQVRDRARDLEHTMIRTRREIEPADRGLEQRVRRVGDAAIGLEIPRTHVRVRKQTRPPVEPFEQRAAATAPAGVAGVAARAPLRCLFAMSP